MGMAWPKKLVLLACCGLLAGCADNGGSSLFHDDISESTNGPGLRSTLHPIDPDAPYPNLASVPPRPNVDWQAKFAEASAGLKNDLEETLALRNAPPVSSTPSDLVRHGDSNVPAPPVLSAVPALDPDKPMKAVPMINDHVPQPPDMPVEKQKPPAAMDVARVVPPLPAPAMPDMGKIAPQLDHPPAVSQQKSVMNTFDVRVPFDPGAEQYHDGSQVDIDNLARFASVKKKRVRVQLVMSDSSDMSNDMALARGANISAALMKNGMARRDIVIAAPVNAAAAAPGGGAHISPDTALITLIP